MPEAARQTDKISHTFALAGLLGGAILGAVIGALACTGVGALAIAAAVGTGASLVSMIGEFFGSLFSFTAGIIAPECSPNVKIKELKAARATMDLSMCIGSIPYVFPHPGSMIAQGSKTVSINGFPAARKTDKLVCGASISSGCDTVFIGEEAGNFLAIDSEVPAWLEYTMIGLGLLSGVGALRLGALGGAALAWRGVARVMGLGFLGSIGGGLFGSWLGAGLFGEGSKGQRIMGFLGSLLGGFYAGARAYRGAPRIAPKQAGRFGQLPPDSTIISEGQDHVIYETSEGVQRIRFDANRAATLKEANPGRNYTNDTRAGLNQEGKVFVHEGRHRSIGAAKGDTIPAESGGVPDAPGVLDYEYTPDVTSEKGVPVKDLSIDYSEPDVSAAEADRIWEQRHGGGGSNSSH